MGVSMTSVISDKPLEVETEDRLGIIEYASVLYSTILNSDTPFVISIQGDWGSGKTSMMNIVKSKLNNSKYKTVWFNTWQFSHISSADELPIIFFTYILKEIGINKYTIKKLFPFVKVITEISLNSIFPSIKFEKFINMFNIIYNKDINYKNITGIKERFGEIIERNIKNGTDRIVIFIDDMDRIEASLALKMLESIKMFLDVKGCIFVIAVDYDKMNDEINSRNPQLKNNKYVKNYIDKIIQLNFIMPTFNYTVEKYIIDLFKFNKYEMYNRYLSDGENDIYINLIKNSVGNNPRLIKKLYYKYEMYMKMYNNFKNKNKPILDDYYFSKSLFSILCLQEYYEPIYNTIITDKSFDCTLLDRIHSSIIEFFKNKYDNLSQIQDKYISNIIKMSLNNSIDGCSRLLLFIEALKYSLNIYGHSDQTFTDIEEYQFKFVSMFIFNQKYDKCFLYEKEEGFNMNRHLDFSKEMQDTYNIYLSCFNGNINFKDDIFKPSIEFTYKVGPFSFIFSVKYSKKYISASVIDLENRTKHYKKHIKEWFVKECIGLPKLYYSNFKPDFINFEKININQQHDTSNLILDYKNVTHYFLSIVIKKLYELHKQNEKIIMALNEMAINLKNKIRENFPPEEEWMIDDDFDPMIRWRTYKIYKQKWNGKLFIGLESQTYFMQNIITGVVKSKWRGTFRDSYDTIFFKKISKDANNTYKYSEFWPVYKTSNNRDWTYGIFSKTNFTLCFSSSGMNKIIMDLINDLLEYKKNEILIENLALHAEY